MARFRNRTGLARRNRDGRGLPDPHMPGSPNYGERTQQVVTELPCGTVRIDAGEPLARLAEEPQGVTIPANARLPAAPLEAPAGRPQAPAADRARSAPDTKPGLGKHSRQAFRGARLKES